MPKEVRKKAMSPWDGGIGRGPSRESSKYTGPEAGAGLEGSTKRKEARMRGMGHEWGVQIMHGFLASVIWSSG